MSFLAPWFAAAGLLAALGPVLIHLLNRRRFKVVEWAAMDFLREAVQRSRRFLRLRDILLLLLRTACLLAFGVAMARPYMAGNAGAIDPQQPVHAVALIDNSLSMACQDLKGTFLDSAKVKVRQWIERLPVGSRISIIPLCNTRADVTPAVWPGKEDAYEALSAIEPVDRRATAAGALDMAQEACRRVPDMPAKQILLVGDAQVVGPLPDSLNPQLARLPAPMRTMLVGSRDPENAWISQFVLQDDVADLHSPAVFLATIRYQGAQPRLNVQVTLTVDGVQVATMTIDLVPDQSREIRFPPYRFPVAIQPGGLAFVTAEVSMTHDRLPADDYRCLVVPVVAALPVVFVDQYGEHEDSRRNRYGETYALRRLLASARTSDRGSEGWMKARHMTVDQLDRDLLDDVRLVVIAGVADPGHAVGVLRTYVEQGGQLLIAAGGSFDPAAWTHAAWLQGNGILPAPLKRSLVGRSSGPAVGRPFQLDVHSLAHDYFMLDQASREDLEDLYHLPFFFQAAEVDMDAASVSGEVMAAKPSVPLMTTWPSWASTIVHDDVNLSPAEAAQRGRARVLASFGNRVPYLVERRLQRGRVIFVSSGFSPPWSTIGLTNTIVVFDRMLRDMLQSTFPVRNRTTDEEHVESVIAAERHHHFTLTGPKGSSETLSVDAVGSDRYAVTLHRPAMRGLYHVSVTNANGGGHEQKVREFALAVNGPAEESQLRPVGGIGTRVEQPEEQLWTASGIAPIGEGQVGAPYLWRRWMAVAWACLLVELVVLGSPFSRREDTP